MIISFPRIASCQALFSMPAFSKTRPSPLAAAFFGVLAILAVPSTLHSQSAAHPAPSSAQFQALSQRAMAALDADHLQDAVPLFRKALALNPRWAEGWWSLGTAFYDQNSYAEAELAFQHVLALDPKHGTAHALLGLCEFELGDDKAALRDIEASKTLGTDIDPQLRDVVFYHEGLLLQRAGRFVAAEKPFASLCLGGAASSDVVRAFGMTVLHLRDRQPPPAGTDLAGAVDQVGRAVCSAAQKDFDSARQQFSAAIAAHPTTPYVHYAFGRVLVDARDVPGAVAQFKLEIDLGHDRVLPMLQIAAAEYKVDPSAGLPYAQQAVALAPNLPFGHYLLGLMLVNTGAEEQAIPELEIARKAFPKDLRIYWSLASAYARAGRTKDAAGARAEVSRLMHDSPPPTDDADNSANPADPASAPIPVTDAAQQTPNQ